MAYSRHSRALDPAATPTTTPARLSNRTLSPPASISTFSPTATSYGQQKINAVTRVAIEGKALPESAAIKMYLKLSIPKDGLPTQSTIPLFPEDNVKILSSMVHPLDSNGIPYNFSSTLCPLLHKAAHALRLPSRLKETFHSTFGISSPSESRGDNIPVIDDKYTGIIIIADYKVSYRLPKIIPSPTGNVPRSGRRQSFNDKSQIQFMVAIDMHVPYSLKPPRAPFLLSIPTPKCLQNSIRLRIFNPNNTAISSSQASLSSFEEEGRLWDVSSQPFVTPQLTRSQASHFADDESSDSSAVGFADGSGIQGIYPSTERIQLRWAKPMTNIEAGRGDGRRRVGVKDSKGEMTCIVRGRAKNENNIEGVLMDVSYKGRCKGIWFAGVATSLGMDVGLVAKGSDVAWAEGQPAEWTISGGKGFTGFDSGRIKSSPVSREGSAGPNDPIITPATPLRNGVGGAIRHDSSSSAASSTSSLLRAPLPSQGVADYSFEGSPTTSQVESMLAGSLLLDSESLKHPNQPFTIHVDMNEILPQKNSLTLNISGTILVTPRSAQSRANSSVVSNRSHSHYDKLDVEVDSIVLPRFTILAAEVESTSLIVENAIEREAINVEIFPSSADIDSRNPKSVLQRGDSAKISDDGTRIALRAESTSKHSAKPRTNAKTSVAAMNASGLSFPSSRPKRNGPLMIPWVHATVTPLRSSENYYPSSYAVRTILIAPTDTGSDWLELGLVKTVKHDTSTVPNVRIVNISLNGVPIKYDTSVLERSNKDVAEMGGTIQLERSGMEWVNWIRAHIGDAAGGGEVVLDYVVKDNVKSSQGRKGKAKAENTSVFLPTFILPVGRLSVEVESFPDLDISVIDSNLLHEGPAISGRKLLHYSLDGYFYPSVTFICEAHPSPPSASSSKVWTWFLLTLLFLSFLSILKLYSNVQTMQHFINHYSSAWGTPWLENQSIIPSNIGTTIATKWRFDETQTTSPIPSQFSSIPIDTTTSTITTIRTRPSPTPQPQTKHEISVHYAPSLADLFALLPLSWNDLEPVRKAMGATWLHIDSALHLVWKLFNKAYHYPLEPPA